MVNPFREALSILTEWTETTGAAQDSRFEDGEKRVDWDRHLQVARHLGAAQEFLAERGELEEYAQVMRIAWRLLFQPNVAWAQRPHHVEDLNVLRPSFRALASLYETGSGTARAPLSREALHALRVALEDLRTSLGVIPDDLEDDRERLLGIVERCFELLDGDAVDVEDLRGVVHEAVSESLPFIGHVPEQARQGFVGALLRISGAVNRSVVGPMVLGIATNRADAVIVQALTGGA